VDHLPVPSGVRPNVFLSSSFFGALSSNVFSSRAVLRASTSDAAWIETLRFRRPSTSDPYSRDISPIAAVATGIIVEIVEAREVLQARLSGFRLGNLWAELCRPVTQHHGSVTDVIARKYMSHDKRSGIDVERRVHMQAPVNSFDLRA